METKTTEDYRRYRLRIRYEKSKKKVNRGERAYKLGMKNEASYDYV